MSNFDLKGKRALVTGANTGIGQGIALALAGAGAELVLVGRSSAKDTIEAISAKGGKVTELRADLGDMTVVKSVIKNAEDAAGQIDILVNNAGIIRRSDAVDFSETDWDDVMDVNLKAVFILCQSLAQSALAGGRVAKVINIASLLSFQGGIRVASYTASKSGLIGLTRILANEWAAKGINVNAIAPGYYATNNTTALREDADRNRQILERIPAQRWGQPSDLGGAAVFLAAAASDYVHGVTLPVDGGWLAR